MKLTSPLSLIFFFAFLLKQLILKSGGLQNTKQNFTLPVKSNQEKQQKSHPKLQNQKPYA